LLRPLPHVGVPAAATLALRDLHTFPTRRSSDLAASGLPALTSADSSLFDITPGAATHLAFSTQPAASYSADATITAAVSVEDALDRKSTRPNPRHVPISSAGCCSTKRGTTPPGA